LTRLPHHRMQRPAVAANILAANTRGGKRAGLGGEGWTRRAGRADDGTWACLLLSMIVYLPTHVHGHTVDGYE
jgi:hypothetical protein